MKTKLAGENSFGEITLLWIDDSLLAINKPAGLLSIPGGSSSTTPFAQQLLEPEYGRLWPVHRLDKETSGVLLFARTPAAHQELNSQFEHRQVRKQYLALISGLPGWDSFEADFSLRVNGDREHRTIIDPNSGRPAQTTFNVMSRYQEGYSLLEARPHTGFTHQIRAHISWLGFPIALDPLYQVAKNSPAYSIDSQKNLPSLQGIFRMALHAASLMVTHPTTKECLEVTSSLPEDFSLALLNLQLQ